MDYKLFNQKFPFIVLEAEKEEKTEAEDDEEDSIKFPKKTKVELQPKEEIEQHY